MSIELTNSYTIVHFLRLAASSRSPPPPYTIRVNLLEGRPERFSPVLPQRRRRAVASPTPRETFLTGTAIQVVFTGPPLRGDSHIVPEIAVYTRRVRENVIIFVSFNTTGNITSQCYVVALTFFRRYKRSDLRFCACAINVKSSMCSEITKHIWYKYCGMSVRMYIPSQQIYLSQINTRQTGFEARFNSKRKLRDCIERHNP